MEPLRNPEAAWSRALGRTIDRAEIERRIGPTSEPIELLSGGIANLNVRVGDRVLRFKDPSTLAKEARLLARPWRSCRTPAVLATGDDFIVLEYLALRPLPPTAGAAVGRALAEIHANTYPEIGFLAGDLTIAGTFPEGPPTFCGYVRAMLREAEPFVDPSLPPRIRAHLDAIEDEAIASYDGAVLTHGDFKVANLHVDDAGALVILDWEFAWAGPRLFDVAQLLRWHPPEPFVRDFAGAYVAAGGRLVPDWRRMAAAIDLGHLLAVYAHNPIIRTSDDIPRRIDETLAAG